MPKKPTVVAGVILAVIAALLTLNFSRVLTWLTYETRTIEGMSVSVRAGNSLYECDISIPDQQCGACLAERHTSCFTRPARVEDPGGWLLLDRRAFQRRLADFITECDPDYLPRVRDEYVQTFKAAGYDFVFVSDEALAGNELSEYVCTCTSTH